jgi:hypothetical protein
MKKVIIASILVCLLAGSAFAQLTLSGDAYAGVQLKKPFDKDENVSVDHRKEGYPLFNFAAAVSNDNYGAKLDLRFRATDDPFGLNGVYAWANFLDNSLRFAVGKISDPVWVANLDPDREFYFDEITGFRLDYKTPLEGLSVGIAFPTKDFLLEKVLKKVIFGATYLHPLFNTVVAYDVGNNGQFLLGANFTGIDDLTSAGIQVIATNLATWDDILIGGSLEVSEKVGYRIIRPLNINLLMVQTIYGKPDSDIALTFTPGAAYRIFPKLTALLDVEIFSPNYFESQTITINPYLEYSLMGPAIFYVEYALKLAKYKGDSYHAFGVGIDIKAF